ncbi:ABC transporter substrate-binding protein [Vibrio cincinnatiensis]|uniref:ABC transporter substrate-binding protein n=1 Tax=Vibrio cincinnatiensis TaxID=675 RepID=UPI001EE10E08|nr:ABC transporter substrate-binding protein [Vibrio cincinnatiensis]MCG3734380.1 ABC transporter substrate-binding protein [Vibrio cincinnatiensis]MCG3741495.1 ABC transporter substrate-binding protein [Vibrio cincinnatiensis]MCG3744750.1 ABC transporter substrate-binding protein [Vibrio cincinnatiensis]MCG3746644.1 ABC transporter substrate-binding protein [Vibrio cincinnatiensis]
MKLQQSIALVLLASLSSIASAAPLKVAGRPDDKKLHLTLVKEVVKRSERFDGIEYIYAKTGEPAATRVLSDLESGKLDIVWTATSTDLEKRFIPVRFPIFRGLLGMRIGLIHQKDSQLLSSVQSKADLMRFKICTGKTWPDTHILDANGLVTAKSLKYPNIFEMMLAGNRCHFFARGVMEPFAEVASHPELPLTVDSHIMLRYRMPYMLFVSKSNPDLAEHLLEIMTEIFDEGLYDEMFFNDSEIKAVLSQANLKNRVIIDLENPYLTVETRSIPERFFYNPLQP